MTRIVEDANGNGYTKIIDADDARTALVDALADMMHVLRAEGRNPAQVRVQADEAFGTAEVHFNAECAGEDGVSVAVLGASLPEIDVHDPVINDESDVRAWYTALLDAGFNFHPDDDFADSVVYASGEPAVTPTQARSMNAAMARTFAVVADPYAIAIEVTRSHELSR